ncbi:MAG: HD domain-containing phosphohydrolase [Planctomycetota bacterium]
MDSVCQNGVTSSASTEVPTASKTSESRQPIVDRVPTTKEVLGYIKCEAHKRQVSNRAENDSKIKDCRVMIVDDEETNVLVVRQHLRRAGYSKFVTCVDAREAYPLAISEKPDLVLLDINMPHVNGLQILHGINTNKQLQDVPVIILTAESDQTIKTAALELGASDFLPKPVDASELVPRVRNTLAMKMHLDELGHQKSILEHQVKKRTKELYESRQQIILSLARAAEHRDNETGNHVIRVGYYAAIVARQLGWCEHEVEMIQQAAQLHDVGKIGVPDEILFKPGKLDESEYDLMKRHCALGTRIISPFEARDREVLRSHARLGEGILHIRNSPLMMMAARIAQTHHEHWDGRGYPLGLAGEDIPIEGRITAVADVFDALSSKRPYKDPFPRQKCFDILTESRGTHFDPKVLDAFFDCSKEIVEIQMALMDD